MYVLKHIMCENFNIFKQITIVAGVIVGSCGSSTIRLRPALIIEEKHINILLDIFRSTLKEL